MKTACKITTVQKHCEGTDSLCPFVLEYGSHSELSCHVLHCGIRTCLSEGRGALPPQRPEDAADLHQRLGSWT
jgi:hypothetical protein